MTQETEAGAVIVTGAGRGLFAGRTAFLASAGAPERHEDCGARLQYRPPGPLAVTDSIKSGRRGGSRDSW